MTQNKASETVTVNPSEDSIDPQAVSNELNSIAQTAERVDLFCISTATNTILPSADTKTSSEIYALHAEGVSNAHLKDRVTSAYPESYIVKTEPIHGFDPDEIDADDGNSTLAATEFKCIGANWSKDTLLPLAPAFETKKTAQLGVRHRPPLADAFSKLAQQDCTGVYHVSIRSTDFTSNDLTAVKEAYENGIQSAEEILRTGIQKLSESSTSSHNRENSAASSPYAADMACITGGEIVEIDPRFILYGPDATKQAKDLATVFKSLNISGCHIEGKFCMGRRARQSYARAFDPSDGIGSKLRSKLRAPQWRLPAIKRLTRNQSTRFYVSEYALPHFISMEASTEGDTGGLTINRRPPTAPQDPPTQVTSMSSDD